MLINPRLPLLCIVVGSFMGLWSGDQQVSIETVIAQAQAAKRKAYVQYESVVPTTNSVRDEPVVGAYEELKPPAVITHEEAAESTCPVRKPATSVVATTVSASVSNGFELPDHIAPGFYRAVNHEGQANIVQVFETDKNSDASARDFYMHESNDQRWYLIRLETPSVAQLPTFLN
ncbi:MAG: hypothetical protein AB8G99_00260 [Planctomycetaceae bacterium]